MQLCPAIPCPFCILGLDHSASDAAVDRRWHQIRAAFAASGGNMYSHCIHVVAYAWLQRSRWVGGGLLGLQSVQTPDNFVQSLIELASSSSAFPTEPEPEAGDDRIPGRGVWHYDMVPPPPPPRVPPPPCFPPRRGPSASSSAPPASSSSSASAPTMPVQRAALYPRFVWESSAEGARKKRWTAYDGELQAELQRAWAAGEPEVRLQTEGWTYRVILQRGNLRKIALHSSYVRHVRIWTDADTYVE